MDDTERGFGRGVADWRNNSILGMGGQIEGEAKLGKKHSAELQGSRSGGPEEQVPGREGPRGNERMGI